YRPPASAVQRFANAVNVADSLAGVYRLMTVPSAREVQAVTTDAVVRAANAAAPSRRTREH
ncbi:MAG: hypothetical protein QOE41_4911, partial [Mycobacterium sp.]|nr:hypothetical protein [Mycobacterium sp.]